MRGRKRFPRHDANRHAMSIHAQLHRVLQSKKKPYAPACMGPEPCAPETFTSHSNIHRCQKCLRWWTTPAVQP